MDERRQQMQHESRQQKMQKEYNKIEKECKKHNCSVIYHLTQTTMCNRTNAISLNSSL